MRAIALTMKLLTRTHVVAYFVLAFALISLAEPSHVSRSQGNIEQTSPRQASTEATVPDPNQTSIVSKTISIVIHWVIVPGILIIILLYAFNLPRKISDSQIRISGKAGVFAGLIVFIIFVVSQQKQGLEFSPDIPTYDFSLFAFAAIILGTGFGYLFAWIVDAIKQYRALGFLVLFIVASTTIAIYGYTFIKDVRSHVVFVSLGIMLGALLHIMWFPEALSKFNLGTAPQDTPDIATPRPKRS